MSLPKRPYESRKKREIGYWDKRLRDPAQVAHLRAGIAEFREMLEARYQWTQETRRVAARRTEARGRDGDLTQFSEDGSDSRSVRQRYCGFCGKNGHNIRTCEAMKEAMV